MGSLAVSPKILSLISNEIHSGNVLWGVARAREYFETDSAMWTAIVTLAKRNLVTSGALEKKILGGARASELSNKELAQLRRQSGSPVTVQKNPPCTQRSNHLTLRREQFSRPLVSTRIRARASIALAQ